MIDFSYLANKIIKSDFSEKPFKHIYIENFLHEKHFKAIIESNEIESPKNIKNDKELIYGLYDKGFSPINFPGSAKNSSEYLEWRKNRNNIKPKHSACEGFGFVLRLHKIETPIILSLNEYIRGEQFNKVLAEKFDLNENKLIQDGGIQKYLDGYEISPHADTRSKALTFMVNINPSDESEIMNHHTKYMKLVKKRDYVQKFWEGNPEIDREWLPWNWLTTEKTQNKNNSIVIFSPNNDTFHAVLADYNHLITQRTQLYGNLWFDKKHSKTINWENLDLISNSQTKGPIKSKNSISFKSIKNFFKSNSGNKRVKRNMP